MTLDRTFQVMEWLVYLAFLGIAIYLILEGQIYQKYAKELTDFTKYDEPINERPTFIVCLKQLMRLPEDEISKLGIDFNISYVREIAHHDYSKTELRIGNNSYLDIDGTIHKLEVKEIYEGHCHKIRYDERRS